MRAALVEAAGVAFRARGFGGTSTEALCQSLGVSGPALYYHFATKTDLLYEVLRVPLAEQLEASRLASQSGSATERVHGFIRAHVSYLLNMPLLQELEGEAIVGVGVLAKSLPPEQREDISAMMQRHLLDLHGLVVAGVQSGEFTVGDPMVAAFAMIGIAENINWFKSDGTLSADEVASMYADLAVRSLSP